MNNARAMWWMLATFRLSVLSIILMMSPMTTLAEKAPGYENYKEGYKGYLGDGIISGGERSTDELARAVQNPIADMISVPFQNNTNFNFGPRERTQNVLNIQPVIPVDISDEWLMITRTILPVVSQPSLFRGDDGRENGLGDTLFSAFFSPKDQERWLGGKLALGGRAGAAVADLHGRRAGAWGVGCRTIRGVPDHAWQMGNRFPVQQCLVILARR